MDFIKAFEEIDSDNTGQITKDELFRYMRLKNYKPVFVEKWLCIFDADDSGVISLEKFCDVLGLIPTVPYQRKIDERKYEPDLPLDHNSNILKSYELYIIDEDPTNSADLRKFCLKICSEAVETQGDLDSLAKKIKLVMDEIYQRSWNVIVDKDAYGSYLSHEPGAFIHIKVKDLGILIWKVPIEN